MRRLLFELVSFAGVGWAWLSGVVFLLPLALNERRGKIPTEQPKTPDSPGSTPR